MELLYVNDISLSEPVSFSLNHSLCVLSLISLSSPNGVSSCPVFLDFFGPQWYYDSRLFTFIVNRLASPKRQLFIAQITASTVTPNSFATCSAYSWHSSRLPDLQIIYPTSPDGNVTGPLHLIIFTGFSPITCLLIDLSFRRCSYHADRSPLFGSCIPCLPFHIKKDENLLNIHTLSGLE